MSIADETVSFSLEINVQEAYTELRKVQTVLYRTLGLLRRFGVGEDVEKNIIQLQRLIMIMNQARLAMIALNATSGPLGWALAGVGVASTVMTTYELMESEMRGLS